jgi:hypothetical protein
MNEAPQTTTAATSLRALRDLAVLAAASLAAASIWAAGLPADALLVDAQLWTQEVAAPGSQWPRDGWYQIAPQERSIEVRRVEPDATQPVPAGALLFRLPGTSLRQGERAAYGGGANLRQPRLDVDYELALGRTRFSLKVENIAKGMQYSIGYGGQTYTYVLGPFDAAGTSVRAVADLDGDARPDFLIDVDAASYLLLSTRARPGANLPTAELLAHPCGC